MNKTEQRTKTTDLNNEDVCVRVCIASPHWLLSCFDLLYQINDDEMLITLHYSGHRVL